ncbi:site-specific integrase [Pseudomonas sp. Bi70]|uniref:site-specific integrase n=1 Tax=Pseudomonas sp. Bi70 TaxID=2821127 RepID=UPI001E4948BA|nr:site-specific integrase [Pseudomonas sp. Bi70]
MLEEELSPSHLAKVVRALGRFYDFYTLEKGSPTLAEGQLTLMLKQFHEARRFGLPSLGWEGVRRQTALVDVRAVSDFTEWCSVNFGHVAANPRETVMVSSLKLKEQKNIQFRNAGRGGWDFLYHLHAATSEGQGLTAAAAFSPSGKKVRRTYSPDYFPSDQIWPMITACPSLRDKLYLILLFFGGLRISEPLHLFVTDVSIRADGVAQVVLGHPKEGQFKWVDSNGNRRTGTRQFFLNERYQLGPRHVLPENHPLHAGWKGMTADSPAKAESVVHWLREDAGRLFAKLHAEYMRKERAHISDNHPYYFVNLQPGEFFGGALKLSNISKAFYRAAQRVGLSSETPGINPHGARHFYGFYCASILELPLEKTNKIMHHASMQSTEVYYSLSAEAVRKALKLAQERLEQNHLEPVAAVEK